MLNEDLLIDTIIHPCSFSRASPLEVVCSLGRVDDMIYVED